MLVSCDNKPIQQDNEPENVITEDTDDAEAAPTETEPEDASLTALRNKISESGAQLGVAYLGCFSGNFDELTMYVDELGVYDNYPFAKEMDADSVVATQSNELYLVVPSSRETTVNVYGTVLNEETYELEKEALVGESTDGAPFFLLCNVSEFIPNVIITTDDFEYVPAISGMDGMLIPSEYIYDFSPYEKVAEYFDIQSGAADSADSIFCGSWFGEAQNSDGKLMTMYLDIHPDGAASYVYGIGNSEPYESFSGMWNFDSDRDMILLDMFGGPTDSYKDTNEPYSFECGFKWDINYLDDGTYVLVLTHEEGSPLLNGTDGMTFELIQINEYEEEETYTYLIGSWGTGTDSSEILLELFDNGTAHYYVQKDGATETDLYGAWHAADMTLHLNLGENADDNLVGEYSLSFMDDVLVLSQCSASPALTDYMAENGFDNFILYGVG